MKWLKRLLGVRPSPKEDPSMNYLIAGLGNIGAEYENTRHNAGFLVADHLAARFQVEFKREHLGYLSEFRHKGRKFILLKPTTYMNLSGKAVRYWLQRKKIKPENLLVVVDDINLDFGKIRLRKKGSHGGHNGLKSIEEYLGHSNYARLRIGIGNNFHPGRQSDYVLGEWNAEEKMELPQIIEMAAAAVLDFGTLGVERTMNAYNK